MAHYVEASAELSDSHRARLTDVAGDILARWELLTIDEDRGSEVLGAIGLAASLADAALMAQVEAIAQDPREVPGNSEALAIVKRHARLVLDQAPEQGR